ncbi:MAG: PHB depolymerase family esterase [Myxococcaceae bacterium]|nr:PHB depolymerase family esterase [Myxococcaceae bacterium]
MKRVLAVLLLAAGCGLPDEAMRESSTASAAVMTTVTGFGSNPGGLNLYLYAPSQPAARTGLVVALHGCTQSAADYQRAGWNTFAEANGFYVLYPETSSGARCFLWYDALQTARGRGQALSVVQGVQWALGRFDIDPARVFVTGLSAGGAMTSELLASYPDVFSAGAVMAGIPARCASSIGESSACQQGKDLSPAQWGNLVRAAATGPAPRVGIYSGDADYVVAVKNVTELMEQWTNVNGVDQTADETTVLGRATRRQYRDASGATRVETWVVSGMGHGTAVAASQGCGSVGAFVLDVGVCSTEHAARFFGLLGGTPPPPPVDAGTPLVDAGVPPPVDAGTPVVDAGTPVVDAGTPSSCTEHYASNYDQVQAGRAVRCGNFNSYACAKGSGEQLGLWNTFYKSWVKSNDASYWSAGRCP